MQDETGDRRWATKLEQHRGLRKPLVRKYARPLDTFDEVIQYNGALIEDWIRIFHEAWDREAPLSPKHASEAAKNEIADIIRSEQELINGEIAQRGGNPEKWSKEVREEIEEGKRRLAASCEVLKYKAFSAIDNQRAERAGEIWKEAKSLFEIGLAIFGAFLLFNQTRIAEKQTEISERTLLANEEPSIRVENIKFLPQEVSYDIRNPGNIALRNVVISSKLFAEDIFSGAVTPTGFPGTSRFDTLKSAQIMHITNGWQPLGSIIKEINTGRKVAILELRFRSEHEITQRTAQQSTKYICLPSNSGFHCLERTDEMMQMLKIYSRHVGSKLAVAN